MSRVFLMIAVVTAALAADASAGIRRVWAVNDGEKVERDPVEHPLRAGKSAWDGKVVRICDPCEAAHVKLAAAITQELRRKK
jgi:hypothetical protein